MFSIETIMHEFDYTFEFSDISFQETDVNITNHRKDQFSNIRVKIDVLSALKAIRQALSDVTHVSDIFTLATVIHVVDRMAVRHGDEVCHIYIKASAWHPDLLASSKVDQCLCEILNYYTGDRWHFEWRQRKKNIPRSPQYQFDWSERTEVALWSGGLDSGAGLINRFASNSPTTHYLLVGTGANDNAIGLQRQAADEISSLTSKEIKLLQVPIHITNNRHLPKASSGRARGVTFGLIGAACAYLHSQSHLHVYENGVGAINLPYCAAEVGLDHSRSVHPAALHLMNELLTFLLDKHFTILNPFLFITKAELCSSLIQSPKLIGLIKKTTSCDSPHRQADLPSQCGYCTSCLLRRQALAINQIEDPTPYAIHSKSPDESFAYQLYLMRHQAKTIIDCLSHDDPWYAFRNQFPEIDKVFVSEVMSCLGTNEAVRESILNLYRKYAREWLSLPGDIKPWSAW